MIKILAKLSPKIEHIFLPSNKKVKRLDYIAGLLAMGTFFGVLQMLPEFVYWVLEGSAKPLSNSLLFVFYTCAFILFAFNSVGVYFATRLAYYRLRDLNVSGNFAYLFTIYILTLNVIKHFNLVQNPQFFTFSKWILLAYSVTLIFWPSSKKVDSFA